MNSNVQNTLDNQKISSFTEGFIYDDKEKYWIPFRTNEQTSFVSVASCIAYDEEGYLNFLFLFFNELMILIRKKCWKSSCCSWNRWIPVGFRSRITF